MLRRLLDRLDRYGTDHPGFRESHLEDRCSVCGWPVCEHVGETWRCHDEHGPRAKWPHRRAAAIALLLG